MTLGAQAHDIAQRLAEAHGDCFDRYAKMFFVQDAADWIREALEAERARCAAIATRVADEKDMPAVGMDCCCDTAAAIAREINGQ